LQRQAQIVNRPVVRIEVDKADLSVRAEHRRSRVRPLDRGNTHGFAIGREQGGLVPDVTGGFG
jgi:hypothetical protein